METQKILNHKKILFLAPKFFGYEQKIKSKMEAMGAIVDFYDARSVTKSIDRAILKISPVFFKKITKEYFNNILNKCKNTNYDYIFIVKCDMISEDILKQFRNTFNNAKFCLYLWDSVANIPGVSHKFKYFDRVLSFDRFDSNFYNSIIFRPLFYLDEFQNVVNRVENFKYDISFCGTIHSDRYKIVKKIKEFCITNNLKSYNFLYLQSEFIFKFYKMIKKEFSGAKMIDFSFSNLSANEISNIVKDSRIVLDMQHPKQTGLTMRTIEMLGMNKKLITTNYDIVNYDFYNPQNIFVIDRENIKIDKEFFLSSYQPLDQVIYDKYSIENWLSDIFSETNRTEDI